MSKEPINNVLIETMMEGIVGYLHEEMDVASQENSKLQVTNMHAAATCALAYLCAYYDVEIEFVVSMINKYHKYWEERISQSLND